MAQTAVHSLIGLKRLFDNCSDDVKKHFEHLPSLLDGYPMEVALGYVFQRLELGQNMALYCGVVKLHRADSTIARNAINMHHMTRDGFAELYKTVFDKDLPKGAKGELRTAEKTRDTIMHGGQASQDRFRNGLAQVLRFAEAVNNQLEKLCQLQPFSGYWRGFSGRAKKLDKRTTRFMLKGIGFSIA